jgi:aryl-alcohol dehydrogenase-like predicted oxidoreductase
LKLALGTVQFGLPYGISNQSGQVSRESGKAIIALAKSSGIDTLDTAIAYGESEACLGDLGIDGFKVITKLPSLPENTPNVDSWVHDQMQASLQRLNVKSVYALLLHRPGDLRGFKGDILGQSLERLKSSGIVQKIGVSIYASSELDYIVDNLSIDIVQAPFNLIDRRLHSSGWLQRLYDSGIEVHARSAFLQGLLLISPTSVPEKFKHWLPLLSNWHHWLSINHVSAADACIGFVQSFPQIARVVVGVDNLEQLQQLIIASKLDLRSDWPLISSDDEHLINPSNWSVL